MEYLAPVVSLTKTDKRSTKAAKAAQIEEVSPLACLINGLPKLTAAINRSNPFLTPRNMSGCSP